MPKNRWTRTGATSGPCNTLDGRFRLTRGYGRVEVVDLELAGPVPGIRSFPNIATGRAWIDANVDDLYRIADKWVAIDTARAAAKATA